MSGPPPSGPAEPTTLLGACSLSGRRLDALFTERDRQALLSQAGPAAGLAQFSSAHAWLAARSRRFAASGDACAAVEGFAAVDGSEADVPLRLVERIGGPDWETRVCGHYVLACLREGGRELTLARDPSSAETLYYAVRDELLVFSATARGLLALPWLRRRLEPSAAAEFLLQGMGFFHRRSLFEGIEALPPGRVLRVRGGELSVERRWRTFVQPPAKDGWPSPAAFLDDLRDATRRAIGRQSQVAVSLSGGIDSATTAAAAVDVLGRQNVLGVTYEYDDPGHPSEAPLARETARALGIAHEVVTLSYRELAESLPETLRSLEEMGPFSRARVFLLARRTAALGLSRTLTGHGIEFLLGNIPYDKQLESSAPALLGLADAARDLRFWRRAFRKGLPAASAAEALSRVAPALRPPPLLTYRLLVQWLRHAGRLGDPAPFYPDALRALVRMADGEPGGGDAFSGLESAEPAAVLRFLNYEFYTRRTLGGKARLTREAGSSHVSPALFLAPSLISWLWTPGCRRRPAGREIQRAALRGRIPDSVLDRRKLAIQAVFTDSWFQDLLRACAPAQERLRRTAFWSSCGGAALERFLARDLVPFSRFYDCAPFALGNPEALAFWRELMGVDAA